ncbi:hypothetical protein IVB02_35710 [Bradyrhizobium sp. 166]|uniref:hypothetical protein n=1 Tax=Bradyrhizobium sp. 166 TaxID=2782638 RepID=UPI001FF7F0B6|nr:hypothetical protein [Bradyrhizobium sp. 166]MCK1606580.1 hypothetical protein [Bradyrhizobium sp. 166]
MKKVLFVSFATKHSSYVRRVQDAQSPSFRLESYSTNVDKNAQTIFQRLFNFSYLRLFLRLVTSDADVFWLWGIDVCFIGSIAKVLRPSKTVVWDISDINPHLVENSLKGRLLRAVERVLLQQSSWLFLTSPEFFERHYARFIDQTKVVVIENYLSHRLRGDTSKLPEISPFKVVYTGIFRSEKLLGLLSELAIQMKSDAEFHVYGYCASGVDKELLASLSRIENVKVHGKYTMDDLPLIHADSHLIFGLLDEDANDNERWLLPNRIYYAGAFRRPILANRGTFTGEVVLERRLGTVCDLSVPDIICTIRRMTANNGAIYSNLQASIPSQGEYFLDGHYRRAIEKVIAALPGRSNAEADGAH